MRVQKETRAIALITVLMAITVLLMFTGAFVGVNRTNFAQVNSSERRDNSRATCEAVYNYVRHRVEHDKTFATADFTGEKDPELGLELRVTELAGTRNIEGDIRSLDSTFQATILNNLNNDAESPEGVPAESLMLRITANSAGLERQVETLMRVAPLFDASALSRGTMNIDAQNFYVRSRDEHRNLVRSEGEMQVPDALGSSSRTRFLKPDSGTSDPKGMLWSKDSIFSGGRDVSTDLQIANANSGGRFVPDAKQHFEIHNLKPEDIEIPSSAIPVLPGEYRFTMATAKMELSTASHSAHTFKTKSGTKTNIVNHPPAPWSAEQPIHVLEYYAHPDDTVPAAVFRSETKTSDLPPPPPGTTPGTPGATTVTSVEIVYDTAGANSTGIDVTIGDTVFLDKNEMVSVNLANQHVTLPPGETVSAEGDFKITTERGDPPLISLGSDLTSRAAIVAKGDINLQAGVTEGYGTLIAAKGDLLLRPDGNSTLDVTADGFDGLVAYASNDVKLENPNTTGDWTFNGLVYARNNFEFDAKGADATLEGTLVARNGNIDFKGAGDVNFIYNPDYLKSMVKALPENRLPVEKVYWME